MSSNAGGNEPGCCAGCCNYMKSLDPKTLGYIMKIFNVINAGLLAFSGIWVFISMNLNVLLILASLYVILFGMILLMFELKLEVCNVFFAKNMGFMFNWRGRLLFFIFVGTLAFGLGLPGLIIGIFTFFNAAWNVAVVCIHPTYFDSLREQAEKEMREAMAAEAARLGTRYAADVAKNEGKNHFEVDLENKVPEPKTDNAGSLPAGWQQRTDEHSGTPYWVNMTTGEQSWDRPT
eukprot:CAMPEP_0114530876 /NCGR_PEP_ID=MMETSP0109-20121206/25707_1 /TAXON_ID=29199 /ORGANISM="Chlorarachnion reptans, Strain CCCM449" /LENGTH=233 /DNA_ID=CAMNT_0001713585 /DNA_START=37 /DNA_END=738 /DNA_ORIENTATION=-